MNKLATVMLLAAPLLLSGCIGAMDDLDPNDNEALEAAQAANLLASTDPLWEDPHNVPHPDFDYPTLTNPPHTDEAPEFWDPIPQMDTPEDPASLERAGSAPPGVDSGAGHAIFGSLLVLPAWDSPTTVLDISNPQSPEALSTLASPDDNAPEHRGAEILATPDGELFTILATDYGVVSIWNITTPQDPEFVTNIEPETGSHNVKLVPGTPILYNGNSAGGHHVDEMADGITEIYDLSDPHEPELVQNWDNGYGCHDISTHIDRTQDKYRAYCAGSEATQIWDIEDPKNPHVVNTIPVHHGEEGLPSASSPAIEWSHTAYANSDGTVLVVGEETGGGAAPACDVHAEAAGQTVSGPVGNLYFYDISDEQDAQLEGWISPEHHYPTNPPHPDDGGFGAAGCTSHFGTLIPHEDRDLMAVAFFGAGTLLIDFTEPANPTIVDQWNQDNVNTWHSIYYNGWIITGDMGTGSDTFVLQ